MTSRSVRLVPYTCGAGASTPGCETGPVALKQGGLAEALSARGFDAAWQEDPEALFETSPFGRAWHDNLPPLGSAERRDGVLWHARHLCEQVASVLKANALPVTLGGDHSMAAGSIAGLARAYDAHGKIGLIWIDAHADINTPDTSPSQALHGMPIAALLGMGDSELNTIAGPGPVLKPEHIFYLGLRDLDPGEEDYIRKLGISAYDREDVRDIGIEKAFATALETVSKNTDHLFLSVDLDAFDPAEAPSVGTPVPDGLRREKTFPVLAEMMAKASFAGIEIAEFNPALEGKAQTEQFLRDLLEVLLGVSKP